MAGFVSAVDTFVRHLRETPDLAPGARRAFVALSAVMDEIVARGDFAMARTVPDAKLETQP